MSKPYDSTYEPPPPGVVPARKPRDGDASRATSLDTSIGYDLEPPGECQGGDCRADGVVMSAQPFLDDVHRVPGGVLISDPFADPPGRPDDDPPHGPWPTGPAHPGELPPVLPPKPPPTVPESLQPSPRGRKTVAPAPCHPVGKTTTVTTRRFRVFTMNEVTIKVIYGQRITNLRMEAAKAEVRSGQASGDLVGYEVPPKPAKGKGGRVQVLGGGSVALALLEVISLHPFFIKVPVQKRFCISGLLQEHEETTTRVKQVWAPAKRCPETLISEVKVVVPVGPARRVPNEHMSESQKNRLCLPVPSGATAADVDLSVRRIVGAQMGAERVDGKTGYVNVGSMRPKGPPSTPPPHKKK